LYRLHVNRRLGNLEGRFHLPRFILAVQPTGSTINRIDENRSANKIQYTRYEVLSIRATSSCSLPWHNRSLSSGAILRKWSSLQQNRNLPDPITSARVT
jgi:hypothetical protein